MRCGDFGFLTKAGKPCGYAIGEGEKCCPHHDEDKSRAKAFQLRGVLANQDNRLPDAIEIQEFQSTADLKYTLTQIAKEICTNRKCDMKRMDGLVRVCGAVTSVLQVEKMEELTEVLRTVEGQGKAVIVFNDMKRARRQALPVPRGMAS